MDAWSTITTHQGNPKRGKTCKQVAWYAHVSVVQVDSEQAVTKIKREGKVVGTELEKTKSPALQTEVCSYLSALPIAFTFVPCIYSSAWCRTIQSCRKETKTRY